jgi:hypothetical protein
VLAVTGAIERVSPGKLFRAGSSDCRLLQYDFRSQIEAFEVETHLVTAGLLEGFHNKVYKHPSHAGANP